jgi:hypothetical protein
MPDYSWTGQLRPYPISPHREVPASIPRPDYADHSTGYPAGEVESKQQNIVPCRSKADIEGLRAACLLGRQVGPRPSSIHSDVPLAAFARVLLPNRDKTSLIFGLNILGETGCGMGQALDAAAAIIMPGVLCDDIDRVVHEVPNMHTITSQTLHFTARTRSH